MRGRGAQGLGSEREWVVGVHRAEGDVGPMVCERVVDLGDAFDPPVMLVIPSGMAGDGFFADVDSGVRVVACGGGAGESTLRAGEGLVGAGDVVSSAAS